jgi:16S rRNA (cytosine967-C5)-methyltransferase
VVSTAILEDLKELGGGKVIDITGGPGGKITHVSQYGFHTVGVDLSYRRVKEIERHVKRMHIYLTDYLCADSRKIPVKLSKFKVILVDPECTGLGRLHHNPEAKMWISIRDMHKHVKLQYELLKKAVEQAAPGTIIYYCTCTLTVEENERQIEKILSEYNVDLCEVRPFIGCESPFLKYAQRLYPHLHDTTGFFIAKLVKK